MSYSQSIGSELTRTKNRSSKHIAPYSGMCTVCTSTCTGPCEIGLSALRGSEATFPNGTSSNQFASEKDYPVDFSHFNINGRVFGTWGQVSTHEAATYTNVDIENTFGIHHPIKIKAPLILPAIAKLNWKDYFAGAALAGVVVVIGEDVIAKDSGLKIAKGKVTHAPLIAEMVQAFRQYQHGYGDIMLQANVEDDAMGVLEYAIKNLGVESVELKLGQASKGIQGLSRIHNLEDAVSYKKMNYLVHPNPMLPENQQAYREGKIKAFEKVGKLPLWTPESLAQRIQDLKAAGAKRICLKTGPFQPSDLYKLIKIAATEQVDMITFDGAGGGSGNSPVKMMNEWGIPTVSLENMIYKICHQLNQEGLSLPQLTIAGGFVTEDHLFKGLALGAPYVKFIGIGRAAMAAAMVGKQVGKLIENNQIPSEYQGYGNSISDIFTHTDYLYKTHFIEPNTLSTGAIGLYSYLERLSVGLQQLMALNRKFSLAYIEREDIVALTPHAEAVTGINSYDTLLNQILDK